MIQVLIAYDNTPSTELWDLFQSCADEAKQICFNNSIHYTSIDYPVLNKDSITSNMTNSQVCVIAAHGGDSEIYNNQGDIVISSEYDFNDCFNGKGLYTISCLCGKELCPYFRKHGLSFFVGYNDTFTVKGEPAPFVSSAMSGFRSILSGDTLEVAHQKMLDSFDTEIGQQDNIDPLIAIELLHNKEALVFEYEDKNLTIEELD